MREDEEGEEWKAGIDLHPPAWLVPLTPADEAEHDRARAERFRVRYYNLEGEEIPPELAGSIEYRRVERTALPGDVTVSTVFLMTNHNYGSGPPMLFETMIFGGPHDQWQRRYCTLAEAQIGHTAVVTCLDAGHDPDTLYHEDGDEHADG